MRRHSGAKRPWLPGDDDEADAADDAAALGVADGTDYDNAAFVAGAAQLQEPGLPAETEAGPALPPDNVGRALATKLGYIAGRGLGKREDGRLTPVAAAPRTRRAGIGVDGAAREARDAAAAASRRHEATCEDDFRARTSAAHATRELRRALATAMAALDKLAAGASDEALLLCADDEKELPVAELRARLQRVCRRLREAYSYCTFCGTRFGSAAELLRSCPGERAEDH